MNIRLNQMCIRDSTKEENPKEQKPQTEKQETADTETKETLEKKLKEAQERLARYEAYQKLMEDTGASQLLSLIHI